MLCPRCGSDKHARYRPPTLTHGSTLRRHKCRDCGQMFLSAQVVVSGPLVQKLLPLLEP